MKVVRIYSSAPIPTFFVTWTLTNVCNYRCPYCPDGLNSGTRKDITLVHVQKLFNEIKKNISADRKIIFAFSGGEPTVHPEFLEIVKFLRENGCEVTMTTNGTRPLQWWKEIEPYVSNFVISVHPEYTDINKLVQKVEYLKDYCWMNLDLMMDPNQWDKIVGYGEQLKQFTKNVGVAYLPVQQDFGTLSSKGLHFNYSPGQVAFLQSPPNFYGSWEIPKGKLSQPGNTLGRMPMDVMYATGTVEKLDYKLLIAHDQNNFKNYSCNIGLEGLIVEYELVYRGYCHVGGLIGNLFDDSFSIPTEPVVCTADRCACSVDIEVSKNE